MVEFISYTRELFLERRGVSLPDDDDVKRKYDGLFQSSDCFFSNGFSAKVYLKKPVGDHHHQQQRNNHKGNTNSNQTFPPRRPYIKQVKKVINSGDKSHVKKAKCVLNVINSSNYAKQYNKMKFIMDAENVHEIVPLILDVGVMQIFYVTIFVNLLSDIAKEYKDTVESNVTSFIMKFLESKLSIMENIENDYDNFCDVQKQKQGSVSSGILMLHLIQRGLTSIKVDTVIDSLIDICKEKKDEEVVIDIVLQIFLESKKMYGADAISRHRSFLESSVTSNKLRFMIQDLF